LTKPSPADEDLRRRAIAIAARARAAGNHPFGALLAGRDGAVLLEAENTVVTAADPTGHAELNLVRLTGGLAAETRAASTLFTSTEPCAMCAGAIYWAGIGRVVYALDEAALRAMTGASAENPTLALPCREVFARGQRGIEVVGPALDREAAAVHEGFWSSE
jgi:tRNA(Arg) A34 adenosine deaminase TadA